MKKFIKKVVYLFREQSCIYKFRKKEGVIIEDGNYFLNPENVDIDKNIYIGPNGFFGCQGGIIIKSGVCIGPKVTILTENHRYDAEDLMAIPYDHMDIRKTVLIEENAWIGQNVTILPGVIIGEGSVVAAGSVVTKNVEPLCVVGGNPAKFIKYRNKDIYFKLKNEGKIFRNIKRDLTNDK